MSAGLSLGMQFTSDDVLYCVMPLFHSNAIITCFTPVARSAAATLALRRRFSASGFLPDVREVRRDVLQLRRQAALVHPRDARAARRRRQRRSRASSATRPPTSTSSAFAERFGCTVGRRLRLHRGRRQHQPQPRHAEGRRSAMRARGHRRSSTPRRCEECPPREVRRRRAGCSTPTSASARSSTRTAPPASRATTRTTRPTRRASATAGTGRATSGTATRQGWFYFAGRDFEWLRVDGENFAAAPIERILARHPDVVLAAVYAVPDEEVGDQVMAALELRPGRGVRPRRLRRRSSTSSPTSAPSGRRGTCGSSRTMPVTETPEADEAASCAASGGTSPTTCTGGRPRASRCAA